MTLSCFSKIGNNHNTGKAFEVYDVESILTEISDVPAINVVNNVYSVICISKGSGVLNIDLDSYPLEDDAIYYIKPGQSFTLDISENVTGFIIRFTREFFELYERKSSELISSPLFNPSLMMPVIKLNRKSTAFMKNILAEMQHEYKNYFDLRSEILQGYLRIFIIYLRRQFEETQQLNSNSRKRDLTKIFLEQLEKNFATKKQVREYASLLSVSPNYLNDSVKEISGFTASSHIQKRVVLEAKRRAIYEGFNMKETAYCLGFPDPAHFSKYFKTGSGVNFSDFRKDFSGF